MFAVDVYVVDWDGCPFYMHVLSTSLCIEALKATCCLWREHCVLFIDPGLDEGWDWPASPSHPEAIPRFIHQSVLVRVPELAV